MKTKQTKGYGSFFASINPESFKRHPNHFIPSNNKLFYNGRHALKYIIDTISSKQKVNTIWLPEYYCQHVTQWLLCNYKNIKFYEVDPLKTNYKIKGIDFLRANDIIIINNFWGTSDCLIDFKVKNFLIIEDHSHGWLSKACIKSSADYCFASLRKSVPAPLGGIAWSPAGNILNLKVVNSSNCFKEIWEKTNNAMLKKKQFEDNYSQDESLKTEFISLVNDAETKMHQNHAIYNLDANHKIILEKHLQTDYLKYKEDNILEINKHLKQNKALYFVHKEGTPFGLTVYFNNEKALNSFKNYLIKNNIYPSFLWPNNPVKYGCFLNIHIDYRYNSSDINYIIGKVNDYNIED